MCVRVLVVGRAQHDAQSRKNASGNSAGVAALSLSLSLGRTIEAVNNNEAMLALSLSLSLGLGVMPCWGSGSLEKSLSPGDMCRLHGRLQLRCQARPKPGQTIKDNIYTSGPPTHRQIQTHSHTHWHIHMQTHTLTEKGHKIL